jgi:succinate dehydrogenase / fumarate reductase iron-sulfur subunit
MNPTGKLQKAKRLHVMMEESGVGACGNAQNCEPVCPKHLPLLNAIASIGRDVTIQAIKELFSLPERE